MAVCDICNALGKGTIVKAKDMSNAVKIGFNPFKEGLVVDVMKTMGIGSLYDGWRHNVISGNLSVSDWNVCDNCMKTLNRYLKGQQVSADVRSAKKWWQFWK